MPQVVNGCGTWYYGKKNVQQYQGVCSACNNHTTLTSYDTRLWVVVIMIPIIPLRRRRIIEECAACSRHGAMPLADYERAQKRSQETIAAYRAKPTDVELAKEALGAVAAFRDLPAFLSLAPEVEKNLSNNAKMLCVLGTVYDLFGRIGEAERLCRAAYEVAEESEEDEVCDMLADTLLRQGKPDEAEPYLTHVVEKGIPDRVDGLYQLAQGWQAKGNHEKALAAFDQCELVNPLIKDDPTFVRLREESAKRLGTTIVVQPGDVVRKAKAAENRRKFVKVAPVVAVLALLAYAGLAYVLGRSRSVHLLSGVNEPYRVRLNGTEYTLQPGERREVRTGEGDVKVEVINPPAGVETGQVVTVRTPLLTRPFRSHDFVINPDGAALVSRTRVYYAAENRTPSQPQATYAAPQVLHRFDGIDHAFEPPPETISLGSSTREEPRDVLEIGDAGHAVPPPYILLTLTDEIGKDGVKRVAQRRLAFAPDQRDYLRVMQHVVEPAEALAFLRTGLAQRPARMEWHRTYQDMMETSGQAEPLEREYDALLAAEPENEDLMYLAGRASRDVEKELALCGKAAAGDKPCGYAVYSLCGYYLSVGDFAAAAREAVRVLELMPNQPDASYFCRRALIAGGQLPKALELARADEALPPPRCVRAFSDGVYVHTLLKQRDETDNVISRIGPKLRPFGEQVVKRFSESLGAERAYASGQTAEFVKLMTASPDAEDRVAAHLTAGDVAAAEREFAQVKVDDAQPELLMYLAASLHKQPDVAAKHFDAAVKLLSESDADDRAFAAALKASPGAAKAADVLRVRKEPDKKAVILAALGLRDPASRSAYFELGRKLNYDKRFPHLLLNQVFDAPPAAAAAAAAAASSASR